MLVRVEVRTGQGSLLRMPLGEVSEGIVVREIEGLDPVKATLVSTSFASMDGEQYHSSRRESRNIKLGLDLVPEFAAASVRDIRKRLYTFFMPKSLVTLRFVMDDGLAVDILGRVETFETPMFTKEPAVDISLICFDPDFFDATPVRVGGMSTAGSEQKTIDYQGSVPTGIRFEMGMDRPLSGLEIYHRPPDGTLRTMEFQAPLVGGDVLVITTIPGAKSVIINKITGTSSALWGLSPQSNWIELEPGLNDIQVYAEGAGIPYVIEYTTRYGGL